LIVTAGDQIFRRAFSVDPHGEHRFCSFEPAIAPSSRSAITNKEMDGESEDPAEPDKTIRVGTLMLAEDY
jgi:hypothetical protein